MPDGNLITDEPLASAQLPPPRGPMSEVVCDLLLRDPERVRAPHWTSPIDDPLYGDDAALALYCVYALQDRGWRGVSKGWGRHPGLLEWRSNLETEVKLRLRDEVGHLLPRPAIPADLHRVLDEAGRCAVTDYLLVDGTVDQRREWRIHQSIFGRQEHVGEIPGYTLASVNAASMFSVLKHWQGARIGYLANAESATEQLLLTPVPQRAQIAKGILFGATAAARISSERASRILAAWKRDESALFVPFDAEAGASASESDSRASLSQASQE